MVSVIIVNFNGSAITLDCVASLRAHAPSVPYEIIVVDNRSSDADRRDLQRGLSDCIVILNDANLGFGAANNLGAKRAQGDLLFFLNNDTVVASDVLTPLAGEFQKNPRLGLLGPALLNQDGTFQVSFGRFPSLFGEWQTKRIMKSLNRRQLQGVTVKPGMREWISGAAMMMRKECFDRIGGFDEGYFMYFEDVDLCYRTRLLGYELGFTKDCSLVHLGGMSHSPVKPMIQTQYRRSQLRFYDKFRSFPERALLRIYLFCKMSFKVLSGSDRKSSVDVLRLLFHSHGS